jgi:hypothetical protein
VIFTAVKCVSPIVHRVLMDMCCAVKDMQVVPGIENTSKTKIRGLFALLKACQGLGIMSEEGESVHLRLGDGINSFKDLKQRHDMFMSQILNHLRVVLPVEVKSQLLWNWNDPEYVGRKVLEMKQLENILEDFFLHGKPFSSTNNKVFLTIVPRITRKRTTAILMMTLGQPSLFNKISSHRSRNYNSFVDLVLIVLIHPSTDSRCLEINGTKEILAISIILVKVISIILVTIVPKRTLNENNRNSRPFQGEDHFKRSLPFN